MFLSENECELEKGLPREDWDMMRNEGGEVDGFSIPKR
jgi:hypothetical protein